MRPVVVPPGVTLRVGVGADAGAVAAVQVDSWRASYIGLLPKAVLDALSVGDKTEGWARVLGEEGQHVVVAESGGRMVGFASVGPGRDADLDGTTGQLTTLYVVPGVWGTGVGLALHDAALGRLAVAGYRRGVVWMLSTNARARRFYDRQGWMADGRLRVQQFGGTVVLDRRLARSLAAG
jgi:GNAT superfamily N-acetyltransferase